MTDINLKGFVIVTQPRCGSYHLVSLIDSADDVRCFGELFKKDTVELSEHHLNVLGLDKGDTKTRDRDPSDFLGRLFNIEAKPIQGFKAFEEHLGPAGLTKPMRHPDWKYIFLTRNGVSSFVSGKRAEKTGCYVMNNEIRVTPDARYKPVKVDADKLRKWLVWQDKLTLKWVKYREELGADRIHLINYRELDDPKRLGALLAFLGSCESGEELFSDQHKQFDRPFWDGIENASEVFEFLSNSEWANLLPELE